MIASPIRHTCMSWPSTILHRQATPDLYLGSHRSDPVQATAVVDRMRRAIAATSDSVSSRLTPIATALGSAFGVDEWYVDLFAEEVSLPLIHLQPQHALSARFLASPAYPSSGIGRQDLLPISAIFSPSLCTQNARSSPPFALWLTESLPDKNFASGASSWGSVAGNIADPAAQNVMLSWVVGHVGCARRPCFRCQSGALSN